MKILITGSNGFLGSHLVKKFLNKNEIYSISLNNNRLLNVLNDITHIPCDINDKDKLQECISKFLPDVVIHCAWSGGNKYLDTKTSDQFHKNVPALANLLEILKNYKTSHFIGIGSGSEYGYIEKSTEESAQENPINLYGTCKLMSKIYTEQFCKTNNIKWTWIRPFYTYGPNDVLTRIIPKTIISCLKRESISLNSCNSIIDYLYIDDFVDAIENLMYNKIEGIFNVCSSKSYKIKNIIEKIGELTNNKHNINFGCLPERNDYPSIIIGSNKKMYIYTQWKPSIEIDEGLQKTIDFYKKL